MTFRPTCLECGADVISMFLDQRSSTFVGTFYRLVNEPCGHTGGLKYDFCSGNPQDLMDEGL